jgi:hypothetical protein
MRWGLIPYWAKDIKIGFSTINARAEEGRDQARSAGLASGRKRMQVLNGSHEDATASNPWPLWCTLRQRYHRPMCGRARPSSDVSEVKIALGCKIRWPRDSF